MDFELCFKAYNLVSVQPGQMANLNVIFHVIHRMHKWRLNYYSFI